MLYIIVHLEVLFRKDVDVYSSVTGLAIWGEMHVYIYNPSIAIISLYTHVYVYTFSHFTHHA